MRDALPLALDLKEVWDLEDLVNVRIDNKAIVLVAGSGATKGLTWMAAKPLSIRAGCLHDAIELGQITVEHITTVGQLGDMHTKALDRLKLHAEMQKLGLVIP